MNWAHLKTFVWLRWRIAVNQIRRSGPGGAIVSAVFTALMVAGGAVALLVGFAVGVFPLSTASPRTVMVLWDVAIGGFVLFWLVGLMAELQRFDLLSFDRFLHLPVSPSGAFLINYVGSSLSLGLVLFLPAMTGLAAGLVLSRGPGMLPLLPLVAAFFLMMTAVTYQFRGWLASLMQNPRRRRAIVAVLPLLFVTVFQAPNLWRAFSPAARERRAARAEARRVTTELNAELAKGRITKEEFDTRRPPPPPRDPDAGYETARVVNLVAPPGWLAYGAEAAAEGRTWPPLLCLFGMGLIGALSLRRAYGTTMRLYTGDFTTGRRRAPAAVPDATAAPVVPGARSSGFVAWRIPWLSERVSAVAVAGLRSWMRAPEMKMTLLAPVFMLVVFAGTFSGSGGGGPGLLRPLSAAGFAAMILVLGMVGPVGNQFGYDRAGFRAFVLGPVPRTAVLLGKNLAVFPFAFLTTALTLALLQWFRPLRIDHLAGVLVQTVPMYLVFCLAANLLSILGPMTLKPGSGMPARHQGLRTLYSIVFMLVVPIPLAVTLVPLGIEAILSAKGWVPWFPAYLVLGLVQLVVVAWLYWWLLQRQGRLLQEREQEILEIVAARAE